MPVLTKSALRCVVVSSMFGVFNAQAQVEPEPSPAAVPPTVGVSVTPVVAAPADVPAIVTGAAPASAGTSEVLPSTTEVPTYKPFITAPSIKPHILNAKGLEAAGYNKVTPVASSESATAPVGSNDLTHNDLDDLTFLLAPNLLPNPLRHTPLPTAKPLFIKVPNLAELKLMLPGQALDFADNSRFTISEYMSNLTGETASHQESQRQGLVTWIAEVDKLAAGLTNNPWQQYQFNRMVRKTAEDFKRNVETQSTIESQHLAALIRPVIESINLSLPDLPTQQAKQAWYNLMVQLRDNFSLYQSQVYAADTSSLGLLESILTKYPQVPRPAGEPPRSVNEFTAQFTKTKLAPMAKTAIEGSENAPEKSQPGRPVEQNSSGGLIVALSMFGVGGGFIFFWLRKRKKATT